MKRLARTSWLCLGWLARLLGILLVMLAVGSSILWVRSYCIEDVVTTNSYRIVEAGVPIDLDHPSWPVRTPQETEDSDEDDEGFGGGSLWWGLWRIHSARGIVTLRYSVLAGDFNAHQATLFDKMVGDLIYVKEGRFYATYPPGEYHGVLDAASMGYRWFHWSSWETHSDVPRIARHTLAFPYWFVVLIAAPTGLALPLWHAWRQWVRYRRLKRGCCIDCGYDLRASSERCPECGRPVDVVIRNGGTFTRRVLLRWVAGTLVLALVVVVLLGLGQKWLLRHNRVLHEQQGRNTRMQHPKGSGVIPPLIPPLLCDNLPSMPRRLRIAPGGLVYHVLNRANARAQIFSDSADYAAFERVLAQSLARLPLELFAYVLMPNHWHLLLRPRQDGDLSQFMRWLTVTHTQRWHAHRHTGGSGHLYQGRFKSFPVESDAHFLIVCRYIERNAVRAGLVDRGETWRWASLWRREHHQAGGLLSDWPVPSPPDWLSLVNHPQTPQEEQALGRCIAKGRPYGSDAFQTWTADLLHLHSAFRPRGHPPKAAEEL